MDFEKFDFELLGRDAMSWKITRHEDHTPVIRDNQKRKDSGRNGWNAGRKQRQLARIPHDVVKCAEQMGYNMRGKGIYRFLADYPQYLAVPYVKSPNGSAVSQGKVIIK